MEASGRRLPLNIFLEGLIFLWALFAKKCQNAFFDLLKIAKCSEKI
jgi:hypothetical protein